MQRQKIVRIYARIVAAGVFVLLIAGALVTSTESGLAVPDWPLSYGRLMPPMVGGILFEHGHRLVAALLSTLVGIQVAVIFWGDRRPALRRLALLAFAAILAQAVLGGLTVLLLLPPAVSSAHAGLAQIVFALVATIALLTSGESSPALPSEVKTRLAPVLDLALKRVLWAAGATFFQILLGAVMRHTGAGLAIPDFPTSFGRILPLASSFFLPGVPIHFAHRAGAVLVGVLVVRAVSALSRLAPLSPLYPRLAFCWSALLATQILLGAFTIWTGKMPLVTVAHLAVGGLCWVTAVLSAVVLVRSRNESRAGETETAPIPERSVADGIPA